MNLSSCLPNLQPSQLTLITCFVLNIRLINSYLGHTYITKSNYALVEESGFFQLKYQLPWHLAGNDFNNTPQHQHQDQGKGRPQAYGLPRSPGSRHSTQISIGNFLLLLFYNYSYNSVRCSLHHLSCIMYVCGSKSHFSNYSLKLMLLLRPYVLMQYLAYQHTVCKLRLKPSYAIQQLVGYRVRCMSLLWLCSGCSWTWTYAFRVVCLTVGSFTRSVILILTLTGICIYHVYLYNIISNGGTWFYYTIPGINC